MSRAALVIGGTGVMGQKIVHLLQTFAPDARVIVGAHRRTPPVSLEARPWDHDRPLAFHAALHGVDVLVDAAGPFRRDPTPAIRACIQAGVHYVDIAEPVPWLDRAREAASGASSAVIPGASTVPGLVEILVADRHRRGELGRVGAHLLMASGQPPGRGMLIGLLEPLGREITGGGRTFTRIRRRDGKWYGAFPSPTLFAGTPRGATIDLRAGFDRGAWSIACVGSPW